jgi:GxxExxY protein
MWSNKLQGALVVSRKTKAIDAVLKGCQQIMQQHGSGQTEAFYHRMLEIHLYDHGIPALKEVDCFTMAGAVPVLVGRIDLEIDHSMILELKVGSKIQPKHMLQLRKYVQARQETGMDVRAAAVICFTDHETVEIQQLSITSPYFARR